MEVLVTGAGWSVGIIVLVLLFKPIFGNKEEFWECVSYWFTPDFFSFFKGEAGADFIAELKLGLWVALESAQALALAQEYDTYSHEQFL